MDRAARNARPDGPERDVGDRDRVRSGQLVEGGVGRHKPDGRAGYSRTSRLGLAALAVLSLAGAGVDDPGAAKSATRVTRLVSPDGRREAHGLYVIGPDGEATAKIVVAEVDGTGRRALNIKLDGAA